MSVILKIILEKTISDKIVRTTFKNKNLQQIIRSAGKFKD